MYVAGGSSLRGFGVHVRSSDYSLLYTAPGLYHVQFSGPATAFHIGRDRFTKHS